MTSTRRKRTDSSTSSTALEFTSTTASLTTETSESKLDETWKVTRLSPFQFDLKLSDRLSEIKNSHSVCQSSPFLTLESSNSRTERSKWKMEPSFSRSTPNPSLAVQSTQLAILPQLFSSSWKSLTVALTSSFSARRLTTQASLTAKKLTFPTWKWAAAQAERPLKA